MRLSVVSTVHIRTSWLLLSKSLPEIAHWTVRVNQPRPAARSELPIHLITQISIFIVAFATLPRHLDATNKSISHLPLTQARTFQMRALDTSTVIIHAVVNLLTSSRRHVAARIIDLTTLRGF